MGKLISRCAFSEMFLGRKIPGNSRSTGRRHVPLRRPQPGSKCRKERPPHLLCAGLLHRQERDCQGGLWASSWAPLFLETFSPQTCMREAVPITAGESESERTPSFTREVSLGSSRKALAKVAKYLLVEVLACVRTGFDGSQERPRIKIMSRVICF